MARTDIVRTAEYIACTYMIQRLFAELFHDDDPRAMSDNIGRLERDIVSTILDGDHYPGLDDAVHRGIKETAALVVTNTLAAIRHPSDWPTD